jgi:hypothetical protein
MANVDPRRLAFGLLHDYYYSEQAFTVALMIEELTGIETMIFEASQRTMSEEELEERGKFLLNNEVMARHMAHRICEKLRH